MKLYNLFCRNFPRLSQLPKSENVRLLPPIAVATSILAMSYNFMKNNPPSLDNEWEENVDGAMRPKGGIWTPKTSYKPSTK